MAKNEAKIKFTAETGGFNDAIKKANSKMTELRAELKLNDAQMKSNGTSVEALENKHKILSSQLAASQSKTEALSQKVNKAAEIYGENSDEVTKLKTQLLNAQTAEEKIKQAIAACNDELEDQRSASEKSESKFEQLTKTIDKQETELEQLKREYSEAVLTYGKTSTEAKTLSKQIDNLSGELSENKKKLDDAEYSTKQLGDTSEGIGDKLKGVAVGVAALGTAAVAFGKSAIDAFNEVDEGADNVIKVTGATGAAAESLEASYSNVASSIVGDFGSIGSALGEVNTRFGWTGAELETASTKFLKFSEITGMDATSAVQAVSRAIESAGLDTSEYENILDALTAAGQATGVSVDTLATSLTDNGAIMREMGYDTNTTIAMLAQFEKAGVDSNAVAKGMRTALKDWADQGLNSKKEFAKMVEGIQNGSVTAAEAYDVFGTKAGVELVDAIKSGRFEYEDMLAVVEGSKGALESTFDGTVDGGYELDLTMQNVKIAMAEAGEYIGTALTPVLQTLSEEVIPAIADGFVAVADAVASAVGWMQEHKAVVATVASVIGILTVAIGAYNAVQAVKAAMEAAEVTTLSALIAAHWAQATAAMAAVAPYVLVVAAIAAVIAIIVVCIKYWDEIVAACKNCWEVVKTTLSGWGEWINTNVIQPVTQFFTGLWNSIPSACSAAWEWVKTILSGWGEWINTNVIQPVVGFFTGLWTSLQEVWNNICNVVQVAIMFIGEIISAAVQIITLPFQFIWQNCKDIIIAAWNSIKSAVSTAINAIKSTISTVMNAIKSVFTSVWNAIKSVVTTVWNAIKSVITTALNAVKNVITTVWNNCKSTITTVLNTIKSAVTTAWNAIKKAVTTVLNAIKTVITTVWNAIKTTVSNVMNGIKTTFTNIWNAIKSTVTNVINGIKSTISSGINSAKSTVSNVLDSIKSKFSTIFESIKSTVRKGVETLKDLFDFEWKLPKIKLPHFNINGSFSLNPPSAPSFSISWYKDGAIFTKPTIFGTPFGLKGVGEAGAEAVLPIEKLEDYISNAIDKAQNVVNLHSLANAIEDLATRPVELNINGRQFAVATASDNDGVNGLRNSFISRGLILE